uniref:Neuropeptide n=1 Tax=Steinernema glaseri TaxID=37863 RepID=A0A1I8ALE6_9BILA
MASSMQLVGFCALLLLATLNRVDAGTWLSFNQNTGGAPSHIIPSYPRNNRNLIQMLKTCTDEYTKRMVKRSTSLSDLMTRQQRGDAELCRELIEMVVARRRR